MTTSLLKIDVASEIQKLTQNRFKTSTEWTVALCQYVMGRECTQLAIELKSGLIAFRSQMRCIDAVDLHRLSVIYDSRQSMEKRHRAIVDIEAGESFDLLCAFYLKKATIRIRSGNQLLQIRYGKPPKLDFQQETGHSTIEVVCSRVKPQPLAVVLERACQFSRVPVTINQQKSSHGLSLPECIATVPYSTSVSRGVVGIPTKSDFVRQVTLKNGIKIKDVLKQPFFGLLYHSILDSAADTDDFDTQRSVARKMYTALGRTLDLLQRDERYRALRLLFARYRETQNHQLIDGVRAFERTDGKWMTFLEVKEIFNRVPIFGILRDYETRRWNLAGRHVFYLEPHEWNFLEEELEKKIPSPPALGNDKLKMPGISKSSNFTVKKEKPFSIAIRSAARVILNP